MARSEMRKGHTIVTLAEEGESRSRVNRGDAIRNRPAEAGRTIASLAKPELRDELGVALVIFALEEIEQRTALVDEHEQAASGVVVLGVRLEMLGEIGDALRQDRDLHFGRPGIGAAPA